MAILCRVSAWMALGWAALTSLSRRITARAFDVATKDLATHSQGAAKAVNEIGIRSPSRHATDAEECACRSVLLVKEPILIWLCKVESASILQALLGVRDRGEV